MKKINDKELLKVVKKLFLLTFIISVAASISIRF